MIYKIIFSILGENFWPQKIINNIEGDFIVESYFSPTDKKFENSNDEYGYGGMFFFHPKKFAVPGCVLEYEKAFVDFLENNYRLFKENGVEDLEFFIELYYDGGQCNFEIFNKELLKKIADFDVSIPVSVYILKEEELQQWENEIGREWEGGTSS